ncbi:N-ethylmaleimide reductase [Haloactinopolyspora alba]|uniref:N-ethylmaleimide reductase n=1 Tax=Haloactinopolyspora alba TaxID=648780 RepID=A0A2P8E2I0_9ACTN|nr:alkene reductase [Haloactinopolyspora alba]PSL03690.1 N-ethylmaleimide reductase [Haloactinopolyspora alba]
MTVTTQPSTSTDPAAFDPLWQPVRVGDLELPHRLAMAPMTRDRSHPDGTPSAMNVRYYAQRAGMSLIVTEGTQPSEDGQGYLLTPGIHTDGQAAGWRAVTDAVHAAGGRIVIQLMHVGRVAHPRNTPHGRQPVAPSAIAPDARMFTSDGMLPIPEPRALSTDEVRGVVGEFRAAARAAVAAGADGVEIHAANGYLLHQFLSGNANLRADRYGGSVPNRIRLAVEVAAAVADEIGPGRTGIRISPGNPFNDIAEHDVADLYPALVSALSSLDLAYLHVAGHDLELIGRLRRLWPNALVLNRGGAELDTRAHDVAAGLADVVTVGSQALANPDLVERLRHGAPLNTPDRSTFYGGDERGYLDYPTLADTAADQLTR